MDWDWARIWRGDWEVCFEEGGRVVERERGEGGCWAREVRDWG